MDRTESTIVQVAPDYENEKIKEMEMFGWNLQNRQEVRERGNAYGRPSLISPKDTYVTRTLVNKYVKLHFVRPFSFPNLAKIKDIEARYFALPFPTIPRLTIPKIIIGILFLPTLPIIIGVTLYMKNNAEKVCRASAERQKEILKELNGLL